MIAFCTVHRSRKGAHLGATWYVVVGCLQLLSFVVLLAGTNAAKASDRDDCASGNGPGAISACTRLLQRAGLTAKERSKAYFNRARAYDQQRDYDRSISDYTSVLQLDSTNAGADINRAIVYRKKGEPDRSIVELTRILDADKRRSTLSQHGRKVAYSHRCLAHNDKQNFDHALADCTNAIRLKPEDSVGYAFRGGVYFKKEDEKRAIADYERAIQLETVPERIALFKDSWRSSSHLLSLTLIGRDEHDRAIALLRAVIESGVHNAETFYIRAGAYDAKKDREKVLADYDSAIRLDATKSKYFKARGRAKARQQDFNGAITDLTEAIRLDPNDASAFLARAAAYVYTNADREAIVDLSASIRLSPSASTYFLRGGTHKRLKEFDGALADFNEAIRLDSTKAAYFSSRGDLFAAKGDWVRAAADFDQALKLEPKDAFALVGRGSVYFHKGDHDRALMDYEDVLRRSSEGSKEYMVALVGRGQVWLKKTNYDRAIKDFDEAIRIDPFYTAAYANRGLAYEGRGDMERARADFHAALAIPAKYDSGSAAHATATERLAALTAAGQPHSQGPDGGTSAGRRIALVIGNSGYRNAPPLVGPAKEAKSIAVALRRLGFAEVEERLDLDLAALTAALKDFGDKVLTADWAVIYFSGHGLEMNGQTYILPTDAQLRRDIHVADEALSLDRILEKVAGARQLRLVVLEACRSNPFLSRMQQTGAQARSLGRGLARVEPDGGVLVAYAAKHGFIAPESGGESTFTAALLQHIDEPGLEINLLFRKVRDDVLKRTAGAQEPFVYGSLPAHDLYFKAAAR